MKNFTLLSLVHLALKHIIILIMAAVVFGATAFGYFEFLVDSRYSATSSILVTNGTVIVNKDGTLDSAAFENSDISASINIADTVCDILETNGIYKALAEKLDNKYTYPQLRSMSSVSRRDDRSLFIDITFTTTDHDLSIELANTFLDVIPSYINSYVPGATTAITETDDSRKIYPNSFVYAFAAAIFGVAVTFCIILLIYTSNTVIQDEEDFSEHFKVKILGTVPDFTTARTSKSYYKKYGYSKYGYMKYGYNNNFRGDD